MRTAKLEIPLTGATIRGTIGHQQWRVTVKHKPYTRTAKEIAREYAYTVYYTAADIVGLFSLFVLVVLAYGWVNG
jgi:hypothetical protein